MVIKRAGFKVVSDVQFLSQMIFECSSLTLFPTVTLTWRTPVAPEIALLTSFMNISSQGFFFFFFALSLVSKLYFFIHTSTWSYIAVL